jgi:hypothetical protein
MTEKDSAHVDSQTPLEEQATGGQGETVLYSPLPWATGEEWGDVIDPAGRSVAEFTFGSDQEFAIRACNAHDELLAALKGLTAAVHDAGFSIKLCVPETAHLLRIADACMTGLQVVRKAEGR